MAAFFHIKKSSVTSANDLQNTKNFPITEGSLYFTKDHFIIYDYKDTQDNDTLKRAIINAAHADTAGVADDVSPGFFDTHFESVNVSHIESYTPQTHSYDSGLLTITEGALIYSSKTASKVKTTNNT